MDLKETTERRDAVFAQANSILDAVDARDGKMSDDERAEVARLNAELNDLGDQIADAEKKAAEEQKLRSAIRSMGAAVARDNDGSRPTRGLAGGLAGRTVGEKFARSPQFRGFMAQFPGGMIPESFKGVHSPPVQIPMGAEDLRNFLIGATLVTGASDTSGGAFVRTDYQDIYVPQPMRDITVLDLITVLETDSDTVEYVRQTSRTNAAAPTAEATAAGDSSGTKPESAMAFEKVNPGVKTIAHWIPATKRALSDAGQLRGIIDADLRYGLNEELEDQIVKGSGSGENFTGIHNTSGIQTQAYTTDLPTTTRKAITKMRTVAMERPTGWLFAPANWESFDLLKGTDNYFFGGPVVAGRKSLWGYPVAECDAVLEGHAFLGNLRRCHLWIREAISVSLSDSHSDYFVRNLVAVLAELRAAFGITKPTAIVNVSLNAAS